MELNDLCKTCEHYWLDFLTLLDHVVSHCKILDRMSGFGIIYDMNTEVPYPCLKCPFDSYSKI